jgi:seryl-tRNA synthetase
MSHRAEDQAVFERLQSLEAEVTRLKEENEALRQKLRLSELQALIRDQGLDKAVADPAVRRHLPEILLQAESVTIRLGESTRRLSDIIVQILRAKALPVGALPVEEGEPEWERLARRIAGVPDGGSK